MLIDPTNTPEQRQLAQLGYTYLAGATLASAWSHMRARSFKQALHQAARGADGYAHYMRVRVSMLFARH